MDCDKCFWLLSTGKCMKIVAGSECEFKECCSVCGYGTGDFKYKGKLYCSDCLLEEFNVSQETVTRYYSEDGELLGDDDNFDEVIEALKEIEDFEEVE
mgnify:CR=1 FL=1